jgi:hypothetical protein
MRRPHVTIARLMLVVAGVAVPMALVARGHGALVVGLLPLLAALVVLGRERLTRPGVSGHVRIFVVLYVVFALYAYTATIAGSPGDVRDRPVALVTMGAILGPLTGALARHWQGCCLGFSLAILPYCGAALALGVVFQVIPLPFPRFRRGVRLAAWTCGWVVWFLGIPVSFLHAYF